MANEPVCPIEAVFYEDDVPGEWSSFIADNARFFTRPVASGSDASVVLGVGFGPVSAVPPSYDRTER